MNLLAFDSSGPLLCAAAEGPAGLSSWVSRTGLTHAEHLLEVIGFCCAQVGCKVSEMEGIVCGNGPGSFTGLRIAMATAKGLSVAAGIPLVTVSALDAVAYNHRDRPVVLSVLDGRKGRYYGAWYQVGKRIGNIEDRSPAQWLESAHRVPGGNVLVCGPESALFVDAITILDDHAAWASECSPLAGFGVSLLTLGKQKLDRGECAFDSEGPAYIRSSDAELGVTRKPSAPPAASPEASAG